MEEPILGCTMDRNYLVYTGHTDGSIRMLDLQSRQTSQLGKLPAPVKDVYWVEQIGSLIAVTFDQQITFWQLSNIGAPVHTIQLPYKTVVSAFDFPYLLLGTSDEKICVLRIDQPSCVNVNRYIDSPLGAHCKLLSADINASSRGWLFGSMDGRGNYGHFADEGINGVNCSITIVNFKAQKKEEYSRNMYYHVNACGFNPRRPEVIFVAGGEGSTCFYTAQKQGDKIKNYKYRNAVTAAKISPNSNFMVYALGNDWCSGLGSIGKIEPKIYVHVMLEDDLVKKL